MTNNEKIDKMLMFFHGTKTLKDLLLEMAEWKRKQMVEKAVKWLKDYGSSYWSEEYATPEEVLDDFRKAMEEE